MAGKIYTKTGDKGETSLFGGLRIPKDSLRVETYGTVDELNSAIGVAIAEIKNHNAKLKSELENIQHDLFTIGSILARPLSFWGAKRLQNLEEDAGQASMTSFKKKLEKRVEALEKLIDQLTEELPELRNFILPGGGKAGSFLHLARSIARRAERRLITLSKHEAVDQEMIKYFNRLSDLLFTMARFVNHTEKQKETLWQKQS